MTLPVGLTTKTVSYTLLDASGSPMRGTVSIAPSGPVRDGTGNVVLTAAPVEKKLDANGTAVWTLPVNDDSDLLDVGWTYTVVERVQGATRDLQLRTWSFLLSSADAATVYLADKAAALPVVAMGEYVTATEVAAQISGKLDTTTAAATYVPARVVRENITASVQADIDAALAVNNSGRLVHIPAGVWDIDTTLQVGNRGLHLQGASKSRGTAVRFTGTGPLLQIGTDNGGAYDAATYDGHPGTTLEHLTVYTNGATALTNGLGNYKAGTYGIRDWRGGDVNLRQVAFEGFEFGFWGIQSDFNRWDAADFIRCKTGAWVGPRSDQLAMTGGQFLFCDRALEGNRAHGASFVGVSFVDNGTDALIPVRIGSGYSVASFGWDFLDCWWENFAPATDLLEAFVEIGVGDAVTSTGVLFRNPRVYTAATPTTPGAVNFVKSENADRIVIEYPGGQYVSNLTYLLKTTGSASPTARITCPASMSGKTWTNAGTGSPQVNVELLGAASGHSEVGQSLDAFLRPGVWYATTPTNSLGTSATLGNGTLRAAPWYVPRDCTITDLAVDFTAAGDANSVLRVVIYADDGTGYPGSLTLDAGTVSTGTGNAGSVATGGTPGIYAITGLSAKVKRGLYWVGAVPQGVTTTQPTVRTIGTVVTPAVGLGTTLPAAGATGVAYSHSGMTGAAPATFTGTLTAAGSAARVLVKTS